MILDHLLPITRVEPFASLIDLRFALTPLVIVREHRASVGRGAVARSSFPLAGSVFPPTVPHTNAKMSPEDLATAVAPAFRGRINWAGWYVHFVASVWGL